MAKNKIVHATSVYLTIIDANPFKNQIDYKLH
jgi:hypothetical protein